MNEELSLCIAEMETLVDKHVKPWITHSSINLWRSIEDPEANWEWLVTRTLAIDESKRWSLSLQIGEELSNMLFNGTGIWQSPEWLHISYQLEIK